MYSRGSEWRRWDLHIHTPGTLKNDQFRGSTLEEKWENYYSDIAAYIGNGNDIEKNIAVIAITDYLSVENYKRVLRDKKLPDSVKLVLPNVELRIHPIASESPVNIHCIFDPEIVDELDSRFFSKLKINYRRRSYNALKGDLIRLGRDYRNDQNLDDVSALRIGVGQFVISYEQIKKILDEDNELMEKTIIVVGNRSRDGASGITSHSDFFDGKVCQLDTTRQVIYQMSTAIFSANTKDILYFIGEGRDNTDEVKRKCGSLKPCFNGCDAHSNERIFRSEKERYCWIKADPTFLGLKQAINEPKDRVFIGKLPKVLVRVKENSTKYISEVNIDVLPGKEDETNIWFKSISILLNHELVVVIGNKGSGKSAVTDIVGLCADSEHYSDFSFLNKNKFLKRGYAERFFANIRFASGTSTINRELSYKIKPTDVPHVQYLPQNYFETICNEIGKVEFLRKEIEKVVFQYIPEERRLKNNSFKELVDFLSESIDREIHLLRNELNKINKVIIELENKKEDGYKLNITSKLSAKQEELRVHESLRPQEKPNPDKVLETPEMKSKRSEMKRLQEQIENYKEQITVLEKEISDGNYSMAELSQLKRDLINEKERLQTFITDKNSIANKYGIDMSELINIKFNLYRLDSKINDINKEINKKRNLLGTVDEYEEMNESDFESMPIKAKMLCLQKKMDYIKQTLSLPEQEYQNYLIELEKWNDTRKQIIGDKETAGTLEYYNEILNYIDNRLPAELEEARTKRLNISKKIYAKKTEIKAIYDEIKQNVSIVLNKNQSQNLTVDSSFSLSDDFVDVFMGFINKSKAGSFKGLVEGSSLLKEKLLDDLDLESEEPVLNFLSTVIQYIETDQRPDVVKKATSIREQVPNREGFYDFLFSLDYIQPHYELRQNGKNLEELSPGEKGALLLIFYLLLDKNDIPLIIDQPEDNLDNQSVAKILVPFIKSAKKRRQIVLVTHNPNLAVVADAEQIVYVEIDKANGNKFNFVSGSIENPDINAKIVDVLEGTMPAFVLREQKYYKEN